MQACKVNKSWQRIFLFFLCTLSILTVRSQEFTYNDLRLQHIEIIKKIACVDDTENVKKEIEDLRLDLGLRHQEKFDSRRLNLTDETINLPEIDKLNGLLDSMRIYFHHSSEPNFVKKRYENHNMIYQIDSFFVVDSSYEESILNTILVSADAEAIVFLNGVFQKRIALGEFLKIDIKGQAEVEVIPDGIGYKRKKKIKAKLPIKSESHSTNQRYIFNIADKLYDPCIIDTAMKIVQKELSLFLQRARRRNIEVRINVIVHDGQGLEYCYSRILQKGIHSSTYSVVNFETAYSSIMDPINCELYEGEKFTYTIWHLPIPEINPMEKYIDYIYIN